MARNPYAPKRAAFTPMIDLSFVILAGFLGVMKFATLEGSLDGSLPKDRGCGGRSHCIEKLDLMLFVADPGELRNAYPGDRAYVGRRIRIEVGQNKIYYTPDAIEDPQNPIPELVRLVNSYDLNTPEVPITIDPRKGVVYNDVILLLDVVNRFDNKEVSFSGSLEND
ncbi:MAG: hypothetical protein ACPG31_02540 [Planctomycetota bacterium]